MPEGRVKLYELAFACRVYEVLTDFDDAYFDFLQKVGGIPDFESKPDIRAMLRWLNQWGFRQFALAYHDLAAANIRSWALEFGGSLPLPSDDLTSLTDEQVAKAATAFEDLSGRIASRRTTGASEVFVRVGPTGAAKILFASRPHSLPPWDDPIREANAYSYSQFLMNTREELREVVKEARTLGIGPHQFPERLGRSGSTLAKLMDEYNWVTVTRKSDPVTAEDLNLWCSWT
jgi:hypothetical protein